MPRPLAASATPSSSISLRLCRSARRISVPLSARAGIREEAVRRPHQDGAVVGKIVDADDPARDPDERAGAGVLGQPLGAANGRGRICAGGPEVAVSVAPQAALLGLGASAR